MDFLQLMNSAEYDFLRTNPRLGDRIILLGVAGSYAYGTNQENSDIDFRGITLNLPSDILGLTGFEQYEDDKTDTVIYGFNKIVRLFLDCNPNSLEMLGLDEDQYLILSPIGRELLEHKDIFLSKRAAGSFGGYAAAQLRRLQNALARDVMPQAEREQHIYRSVSNALDDFNRKNSWTDGGSLRLYIDDSDNPDFTTEIFVDTEYKHIPLRWYGNLLGTMNNVLREYDKIGKRNRKKDSNHLNKHAMHLVRLLLMGIDILERAEIKTHREDDLDLLWSIRRGDYMKEDGTYAQAFYDIVADYENRMKMATEKSCLLENPDMERVEAFMESVNRRAIEMR
ncbi:MAG: nucleotidyltransferase domain-containing protein [Lachnospiraceae bacterium]|nr:nucleotidyltransferase domain-containing protein [Lachnospiraceae bacterium]